MNKRNLGAKIELRKKRKKKTFVTQNKIQNFKGGQNKLLKMEGAIVKNNY